MASKQTTSGHFPRQVSVVQPTEIVQTHQVLQKLRVSEAEVDELKQSLRYVEIQLAKAQESKEALQQRIKQKEEAISQANENLGSQLNMNKALQGQVEHLQKKIDSFSNNQSEIVEKSRFKASSYMNEINQREEELGRVRQNLVDSQEENKNLTVTREKFRKQNEFLAKELKTMELDYEKQKRKIEEQQRLIDNLCVTKKVQNQSLIQSAGGNNDLMMQKAAEEATRNERIALGTNRSTFLHLGEKKTKLTSESDSSLLRRQKPTQASSRMSSGRPSAYMSEAQRRDQVYISDESVPSQIFPLVEQYRGRLLEMAPGRQDCVLLIDDFFAEAHNVLKDTHLKEIARIKNENNVEVMKLKKSLEQRLISEGVQRNHAVGSFDKAKDNHKAHQAKDMFADNEAERQRRLLTEENELLKKRLRAVEAISQSGNMERAKFMEGASWIAKKGLQESNNFWQRMHNFATEFEQRTGACIVDPRVTEVDGKQFLKVKEWAREEIENSGCDLQARFESLLENVNYHMSEVTKQFGQKKN